MEKINLVAGQTFELIPMGIDSNLYSKRRAFSFISDLDYSDIENAFRTENISKIEYYSASDELLKTYEDCVSLKMIAKEFNKEYEDDKFADVYVVELEML